jgi:hypothetical protein
MKTAHHDDEFREGTLGARARSVRPGDPLTGDPGGAEDPVQHALVQTYLARSRVRRRVALVSAAGVVAVALVAAFLTGVVRRPAGRAVADPVDAVRRSSEFTAHPAPDGPVILDRSVPGWVTAGWLASDGEWCDGSDLLPLGEAAVGVPPDR